MIPLSYRDEYMSALRALSLNDNPAALSRMLDRAQRWAASIDWTSREVVIAQLTDTNALVPPVEAQAPNMHLRDAE